jgi:hypothetical protein
VVGEVEKNTYPGSCTNTMQTSESRSPKTEKEITHHCKNIMHTSEVQCSQTETEMEHQCHVTEIKHLQGEVKGLKKGTEMEHPNSDGIKQYQR